MTKRRARWRLAAGTALISAAGVLATLTLEALVFDWPWWVHALGAVACGGLGFLLLRRRNDGAPPPVAPLVPVSNLGNIPRAGARWVSLWDAQWEIRTSSLLDPRHSFDGEGTLLTPAGRDWLGRLVWCFAEDCPAAVRGGDTPDPHFNHKVLWWWIRTQAAR